MDWLRHLFVPHHTNNQRAKLLHPSALVVVMAVFLVIQFTITKVAVSYPQILGYASQIPPEEIIRLTNVERSTRGLTAVVYDAKLSAAAAHKAADMFARDYWAHVSPAGTQPWAFITDSGYEYRYAGENLARDFADPGSVVKAWMNSPSHRENLLNARYADIGVAVVDGKLSGRETTLVVQMFGTKLSAAPAVTSTSISVKAAENVAPVPPVAAPAPLVTPFHVTKYFSVGLLAMFALILAVDIWMVHTKKIARWTSKSMAHFIFILALIIAAAGILRGQII